MLAYTDYALKDIQCIKNRTGMDRTESPSKQPLQNTVMFTYKTSPEPTYFGKSIIALSLSLGEVFLRFCFIGIYFSVPCFFLNVFLFPPWNYSELIIQSFVQKISSPHIYLFIRLFMSR